MSCHFQVAEKLYVLRILKYITLLIQSFGFQAIFTALIKSLPPIVHPHRASPATRVLIIVHTAELAQQAANTVKSWWPDLVICFPLVFVFGKTKPLTVIIPRFFFWCTSQLRSNKVHWKLQEWLIALWLLTRFAFSIVCTVVCCTY